MTERHLRDKLSSLSIVRHCVLWWCVSLSRTVPGQHDRVSSTWQAVITLSVVRHCVLWWCVSLSRTVAGQHDRASSTWQVVISLSIVRHCVLWWCVSLSRTVPGQHDRVPSTWQVVISLWCSPNSDTWTLSSRTVWHPHSSHWSRTCLLSLVCNGAAVKLVMAQKLIGIFVRVNV